MVLVLLAAVGVASATASARELPQRDIFESGSVPVGSLVLSTDEFEGFVRQADKVLASLRFPS